MGRKFKNVYEKELRDILIKQFIQDITEKVYLSLDMFSYNVTPDQYERIYHLLDSKPSTRHWREVRNSIPTMPDDDSAYDIDRINDENDGVITTIMAILDKEGVISFDENEDDIDSDEHLWDENDDSEPFATEFMRKRMKPFTLRQPLKDAKSKTLVLKIKIKYIQKPPIWREIEIPADSNFKQLHRAIQTVFGWENAHLWQFQEKAYDSPYSITEDNDEDMMSTFMQTLDPKKTKLTSFLANVGDKIEYVYDYGDDWIHEICVKNIIDKQSKHPVLVKAKGDMLIEDVGGPFGYMEWRDVYLKGDELSKKEQNEFLESAGFEDMDDFKSFMDSYILDLDSVNEDIKNNFQK